MNVECKFIIQGEITDFGRIDNAFSSIRTQAKKLLKEWEIAVEVNYVERVGKGEIPE